jgi:hypothetical protein
MTSPHLQTGNEKGITHEPRNTDTTHPLVTRLPRRCGQRGRWLNSPGATGAAGLTPGGDSYIVYKHNWLDDPTLS